MSTIESLVQAELDIRAELKYKIIELINERCEPCHGRVQRGALHLYLYRKLGFHGHPGNKFAIYINKIMQEQGYRDSYLVGKRCYYGLKFKNEKTENWRNPEALDIPRWMDNIQKFEFIENVK